MPEWIKWIVGGAVIGLIAAGATSDITDDVARACIAHNATQGRTGLSTNQFCLCSGKVTAQEASIPRRLLHQVGVSPVTTPYDLGTEFGKQTDTVCNALR